MNDLDYYLPDFETGEPVHVGNWLREGVTVVWRKRLDAAALRLAILLTEGAGRSVVVLSDEKRRSLIVQAKRLPRGLVPETFEDLPVHRG